MPAGLRGRLALACCVALLAAPGAARAQSTPDPPGLHDLHGGAWIGAYWPGSAPVYTLTETVAGDPGGERTTRTEIQDVGVLLGVQGSLRPRGWPVGLRLGLAQVRGAESRTVSAFFRSCPDICIPEPIGPSARAVYASDLTITLLQLDAVVEPAGRIGPLTPRLLLGVAPRHHDYGRPRFRGALGAGDGLDPARIRFPRDGFSVGLHLGSAVSVPAFGRELSVRFGDHVTVDARTVGTGGRAEAFLRHDLHLGAGIRLF